jgi:hypothetical protein
MFKRWAVRDSQDDWNTGGNMKWCALALLVMAPTLLVHSDDTIVVTPDGKVGIGTDNPQEKLHVNGRIRDLTGMLMPVGAVLPFAGPASFAVGGAPDGWLLCDGRTMSSALYHDLYVVIGTRYGDGSQDSDTRPDKLAGDFNLPDLRGMFLRGVDDPDGPGTGMAAAGVDPDSAGRVHPKTGAALPDVVGSKQLDAFQGHGHTVHGDHDDVDGGQGNNDTVDPVDNITGGKALDLIPLGAYGSPRASTETRPKNIYVNFIIKY